MTELAVHPYAELIPAMTDEEFEELRADIEANGQQEKIRLYEGKILDGRHRYRACRELGIEPVTATYNGDAPAAYVISLNVKRRSLSTSQRAALAVEFLPELEREARKRKAEAGRSSAPGRPAEKTGSTDPVFPRSDHRAREDAGALVGVSGASVDRARRVKERAPEDFERIKAGETTVRAVDERLRREKAPGPAPEHRRRRRAAAPPLSTKRGRQVAEAHHRRLGHALSQISGLTEALQDADLSTALSVAAEDEAAEWSATARRAASTLTRLSRNLKEST